MPTAAWSAMSTPKVAMIAPEVSARRIGRSTRNCTMTPRTAPAAIATMRARYHDPVIVWTVSAMKVVNIAWPT